MSRIVPPDLASALSSHNLARHQILDIHHDTLPSLGYVKGLELLSYGASISSLDAADGVCLLHEAVLGPPAALSADTVYICSSSASDTGTYRIQGMDANNDYQDVTVTATGTTAAAVSGTWNHVQSCVSVSADNVGTVYVSTDPLVVPTTLGDQIQTVMLPGKNYAVNPVLGCPNNWIILINAFDFSTDTVQALNVEIDANREGRWLQNFFFFARESRYSQVFHTPIKLWAGDYMRVKIELTAGTNAAASFGMNGTVWRNDLPNQEGVLSTSFLFEGQH